MARILAIDYGKKRTGIAVTDPLQIIATPLETIDTTAIIGFLNNYFKTEEVERVLIGYPLHQDGNPTDATPFVEKFIKRFSKLYPQIPIEKVDESMTSVMAAQQLATTGLPKKKRQEKGRLDMLSALIILQDYLDSKV